MAKTTQKIDRLSNYTLTLGLKGTQITSSSVIDGKSSITFGSGAILNYTNVDTSQLTSATLTPKSYVDDQITATKGYADDLIVTKIKGSNTIQVTTDATTKEIQLDVKPVYNSNLALTTIPEGTTKVTVGNQYAYFTGQNKDTIDSHVNPTTASTGNVITAIKVDEYGSIIDVKYKQINASDINNDNVYDNYKSWQLNVNNSDTTYDIYGTGSSNTPTKIAFTGKGITLNTSTTSTTEDGTEKVTSYNIEFVPTVAGDLQVDGSGKLTHVNVVEAATSAVLKKIKYDVNGHITGTEDVSTNDLTGIIKAFSSTNTLGLVDYNATVDTNNTKDTKFLTQDGTWAAVKFSDVAVGDATEELPLVVSKTANITGLEKVAKATVSSDGTLKVVNVEATNVKGDGSQLTNLNATNLATGTLASDRLPIVPVAKGGTGNTSFNNQGVLIYTGDKVESVVVNTESADNANKNYVLTQSYDANKTITTQFKDINKIVGDHISNVDALVFKGTIGLENASVPVSTYGTTGVVWLPELLKSSLYDAGWTYSVVGESFLVKDAATAPTSSSDYTYKVEVGDKIMAIQPYESSIYPHFVVSQANLDGAITYGAGDASTTVGEIAVFNDEDGRTIKGAGNTVTVVFADGKSTINATSFSGNAATATKLATPVTLWGNEFDGTQSLDSTNTITSGTIIPAATETYDLGSVTTRFANIYGKSITADIVTATSFKGNADTATTADKVANALTINGLNVDGTVTNVTYDGSSAYTISAELLGALVDVDLTSADTGIAGNVISTLSLEDGTNTRTLKYTTISALTNLNSSLLEISGTTEKTIAPYSTRTNGSLYSLSTNELSYGGTFTADVLKTSYAYNSGTITVPALTKKYVDEATAAAANGKILVAETDTTQTNGATGYGFKASEYEIKTTVSTTSDTEIPTSKAVANYVQQTHNLLNASVLKTTSLHITSSTESPSTLSTTETFKQGSVIRRIAVSVENPMGLTALSIGISGTTLAGLAEVDPNEAGLYIVDLYHVLNSDTTISASYTGAASGSIRVYIDYNTPAA